MSDEKIINQNDHSQNCLNRARSADTNTFLEAGVCAKSVEIKKISYHQVLSRTVKNQREKSKLLFTENLKIE